MTQTDLTAILERHRKWIHGESGGEKADLSRADLSCADLSDADLSRADLNGADLRDADLIGADLSYADLRGANLSHATLSGADLSGANLIGANLSGANLRHANLSHANLIGANLRGADLDYASYPLSCKGLHLHIDDRLGVQLLYHAVSNILYSKNTSDQLKKEVSQIVDTANRFHRVDECGKLTKFEEHKEETP